jgi:hypothetical protein
MVVITAAMTSASGGVGEDKAWKRNRPATQCVEKGNQTTRPNGNRVKQINAGKGRKVREVCSCCGINKRTDSKESRVEAESLVPAEREDDPSSKRKRLILPSSPPCSSCKQLLGGAARGRVINESYLVEDEVAAVVAGELGDAEEGDLGGVVEVVDDDDAEALLEQLQHGVAADVPGAARHQDGPQHGGHHLLLLDSDRSGEGGRGRGLLARKKEGEDRPEFGGGGMERWAVRALDEF